MCLNELVIKFDREITKMKLATSYNRSMSSSYGTKRGQRKKNCIKFSDVVKSLGKLNWVLCLLPSAGPAKGQKV